MKIMILSDIHGNKTALEAVQNYILQKKPDGMILLGDLVDYGPHSNEVIQILKQIKMPVFCNISGNHERAVLTGEYDRFSTDRGRASARYTRDNLKQQSWDYMNDSMEKSGQKVFFVEGKKCLAVHGSLKDEFWDAIGPDDDLEEYFDYDYVFSGHSHLPHVFSKYYKTDNAETRNKKRTVFVNPGSVGQPRNLNPRAQFAVWDTATDEIALKGITYDIKKEQEAFSEAVDAFYKKRLENGV